MEHTKHLVTTLPERYQIIATVSQNLRALVLRCSDMQSGQQAAIKIWPSQELEIKEAVERQFKLLSKIQHSFVIKVSDRGLTKDGYPFLVSEWIDGGNLAENTDSFTLKEKLDILAQLAECLDFLHALGYLHGDIKPANVLLVKNQDGPLQLKLTDFEFLEAGSYLSPRVWKGTPAYMAPEVIRAEPVSFTSDIYSLGISFFQFLTGRVPFDDKDLYSLAYAQLEREPAFTNAELVRIPPVISSLVLSLLRKNPTERPEEIWKVRDLLIENNEQIRQADKRHGEYLANFLLRSRTAPYSSRQELEDSLQRIFRGIDPEGSLSIHLMTQSAGNPGIIGHYLDSLLRNDIITRAEGRWNLGHGFESLSLSNDIVAKYLPGDLSVLSQNARRVLQTISVFKFPVGKHMIQELVAPKFSDAETDLAELQRSGWLQIEPSRNGSKIGFTKGADREFVLNTIDSEQLSSLRAQTIELLESRLNHDEEPDISKELLSLSVSQKDSNRIYKYAVKLSDCATSAGLKSEALYYSRLALEHSSQGSDEKPELYLSVADLQAEKGMIREAIANYSSFLSLTGGNANKTAEAERKLGWCHALITNFREAEQFLNSSIQYYRNSGQNRRVAKCLLDLSATKQLQRRYEECQTILNECKRFLADSDVTAENAKWHNEQAILDWSLGNYNTSTQHYISALEIYQAIGLDKEAAHVANNLALLLRDQGNDDEALSYIHRAIELSKDLKDLAAECHYYNNLSLVYRNLNRFDEAMGAAREAIRLAQKTNNLQVEGLANSNLGFILISIGSFDQALFHLQQALSIFKKTGDLSGEALAYFNTGEIYRIRELRQLAAEAYARSTEIRRKQQEKPGIADNLAGIARLYFEELDFEKSEPNLTEALILYRELDKKNEEAQLLMAKAEALALANRLIEAQQILSQVSSESALSSDRNVHTYRAMVEGLIEQGSGDIEYAARKLREALLGFIAEHDKAMQAKSALYLGNVYRQEGNVGLSSRYLRESLGIFRELKVLPKIQKLEAMMKELKDVKPQHLQTLLQVSQMLNQLDDEEEFLQQVLNLAMSLLGAERGAIIFYDEPTGTFEIKVASGLEEETAKDALQISKRTVIEVQQTGRMFISENSLSDPLLKDHQSVRIHNILSIVCVPLNVDDNIIGALYLDSRSVTRAFSPEDRASIEALANLVSVAISKVQSFSKTYQELFQLREKTGTTYVFPKIVGKSTSMQEVFNLVVKAAPSRATILIQGETGTGKELFAELVHELSDRKNNPFIRVNCAAIPETLLESELFGIEEKTATGVRFREGKFKQAHGGTIFLDEVGDMSLSTQAKVLRVLQEREFERVGGSKTLKVDVRVIAATNKDLEKLIKENAFRLDLYYRLNAITIFIPPLRERKGDIPLLINYFLEKHAQENGKSKMRISPSVVHTLCEYEWPGNVRELINIIQRGVVLADQGEFTDRQLPPFLQSQSNKPVRLRRIGKLRDHLKKEEEYLITEVLKQTRWNQAKAASILDIPQSTLSRKIKEHKIKKPKTFS